MPGEEEIQAAVADSFILYLPKDIVSGDFYWYSRKGEELRLAVADCTGHGVPGGFMSMIGNSLLNEVVNEKQVNRPDVVLEHLKEGVIKALKQDEVASQQRDGMDIAFCNINLKDRTIQYAGAYNPLYLIRKPRHSGTRAVLEEVKGDRQPIGIHVFKRNLAFTNHTIQAQPGDTLYLFTDGYPDQFGGQQFKKFNYKRFRELLLTIHDQPLAMQKEFLVKTLRTWQNGYDQVDDICVMGVRL